MDRMRNKTAYNGMNDVQSFLSRRNGVLFFIQSILFYPVNVLLFPTRRNVVLFFIQSILSRISSFTFRIYHVACKTGGASFVVALGSRPSLLRRVRRSFARPTSGVRS